MIKANELRIGNLVNAGEMTLNYKIGAVHIHSIVAGILGDQVYVYYQGGPFMVQGVTPIPLTSEWLERLGFDLRPTHIRGQVWQAWSIAIGDEEYLEMNLEDPNDPGWDIVHERYVITHDWEKCQYVHQLQNLFFALTGEELTVKEVVK